MYIGAAFAATLMGYLVVLTVWRSIPPPTHFHKELIDLVNTSVLKGPRPKRLSARVRRYFRVQAEILWAVRLGLRDILGYFLLAVGLATAVFLITCCAVQFWMPELEGLNLVRRAAATSRVMSLGFIDAISFDMFSLAGIELRPQFPDLAGRTIVWLFYALSAYILAGTTVNTLLNLQTILVAIVLPEPICRLANERKKEEIPHTALRRFLGWITFF